MNRSIISAFLIIISLGFSACGNNQTISGLENRIINLEAETAALKGENNTLENQYSDMIEKFNTSANELKKNIQELESKIKDQITPSSASIVNINVVDGTNAIAVIDFNKDVGNVSFLIVSAPDKCPGVAQVA